MPSLRLMLVALASAAVLIACGGDGNDAEEQETRERVLGLAAQFAGDDPSDIPITEENYDCVIHVAVVPDPPASPLEDVIGSCLWSLSKQGSTSWTVTFRETWRCSDWSAEAAGYPPCDGVTGSHEWKYFVDMSNHTVTELDDSGQFAPDMRLSDLSD